MMPPDAAVLQGLAPTTHQYTYRGQNEYRDILLHEHDLWQRGETTTEFVIFTHLDQQTFQRDFLLEPCDKLIANSWKSHCPISQCLQARLKSSTHGEMVFAFHDLCRDKLVPMGLQHALHRPGRSPVCDEGTRAQAADHSLRPRRLPAGRSDKWPSVAVEVGFAESRAKRQHDLCWWLSRSDGEVKVAIGLSTHKLKREIVVEVWGIVDGTTGKTPTLQQEVVISKEAADSTANVTNAPLTIAFESLFLRPANQPAERDIELTDDDLREMAEAIWETQSF